jgi:hypothetical protein
MKIILFIAAKLCRPSSQLASISAALTAIYNALTFLCSTNQNRLEHPPHQLRAAVVALAVGGAAGAE